MKTDFGKLTQEQMDYWDQKRKEFYGEIDMPDYGAKEIRTGESITDRPATPIEQMTSDIKICTERLFGLSNSVRNTADRLIGGLSGKDTAQVEVATPETEYGQLSDSIVQLQTVVARMQEQVDRFTQL